MNLNSSKFKKAQGLSLNTVVIAAMVILVLIVIAIIVIRSSGQFATNTGACSSSGGVCGPSHLVSNSDVEVYIGDRYVEKYKVAPRPDLNCGDVNQKCYIVLG